MYGMKVKQCLERNLKLKTPLLRKEKILKSITKKSTYKTWQTVGEGEENPKEEGNKN